MSRLIQRNLRHDPPRAIRGEGIYIEDSNGRRIIDGSGGAAVACLGHGHPRVLAAMAAQMQRISYAHTALYSCDAAEQLAELVLAEEPGGLSHMYLCSSGSEAVEAALKMARQFHVEHGQPQRHRFIARRQSYHGNTLGGLGAGHHAGRRTLYAPLLADVFSHVAPCYAYRDRGDAETDADYVARLAAELEAEFQRLGPDLVAGFIAEPVSGASLGCALAVPGYFPAMRAVCDRHGALLILDEVMCGMGRTGSMHAWEQEGVAPDIQVVAKGLGGGYQPIGGILVAGRVIAALRDGSGAFVHGHTYQAHPVAAAAALAVQQVIRDDALLANVQAMGARLEAGLVERLGNHRHIGDIRGRGLFWATEFVADRATRAPFDPALKLHDRVKHAAYARGLACYPSGGTIDGLRGDHALLAPPYIAQATDIDAIVERFGDAVDDVFAALPAD